MKYVGVRQVIKAVNADEVSKVYIGKDAEEAVIKELVDICQMKNIEIVYIDTMQELGEIAEIDVKAATAAE